MLGIVRALQDDRLVRADTCFWRSLKFKCSSCLNTNTWGSQKKKRNLTVSLCQCWFTHNPLSLFLLLLGSIHSFGFHVCGKITIHPGKNYVAIFSNTKAQCVCLIYWVQLMSELLKNWFIVIPSHLPYPSSSCTLSW